MLVKFDLIHTKGLKGVNFKGQMIPLGKITDELAEQMEGKTHILKRKSPRAAAAAVKALEAASKPAS